MELVNHKRMEYNKMECIIIIITIILKEMNVFNWWKGKKEKKMELSNLISKSESNSEAFMELVWNFP